MYKNSIYESSRIALMKSIAISVATIGILSCSWFTKSKQVETSKGVGDIIACVIMHDNEPSEQILKDCEGIAIEDIVKILAAHKLRMAEQENGNKNTDAGQADIGK